MLHFTYISQLGWTMNDFRSLNQNCYLLPTDSALNRHLSIWNMRHSKNWWFQQFGTNMPIVYEFTNKFVNKLMILCKNGKCKSNIKINTIKINTKLLISLMLCHTKLVFYLRLKKFNVNDILIINAWPIKSNLIAFLTFLYHYCFFLCFCGLCYKYDTNKSDLYRINKHTVVMHMQKYYFVEIHSGGEGGTKRIPTNVLSM